MTTVTKPGNNVPSKPPAVSPLPNILGLGGALAGLVGGLAMLIVAAIISFSLGGDIWLEAKQISAMVLGPTAATSVGFAVGPIVLGTIMHFVFAAVFGAIFGILYRTVFRLPSDFGTPILAGLIYGMLIWAIAYFIVLPATDSPLLETYAPAFIVQHLVYGIVTGLVYIKLRPVSYHDQFEAMMAGHENDQFAHRANGHGHH